MLPYLLSCRSGGIGRRAGFKIQFPRKCGFDSRLRYKTKHLRFFVGAFFVNLQFFHSFKRNNMQARLLFFLLSLAPQLIFAQLTIQVNKIPINTPANTNIFIAGNFQGWNPGDTAYQLEAKMDGTYDITITPPSGKLEFKFTQGDWNSTEGNENGNFLPNRQFNYTGEKTTIPLEILSWENGDQANSTATSNVRILNHDFPITSLNRVRRIWVYLPPDYSETNKHYPVLYLQDGQNVFDAATSFSGEWQVDESLNNLFDQGDYGCIVIAIDNGGTHRIDEYSPWINNEYGGGEGDEYLTFIVNELKPVIDANFRTFKEREFTGIMGSSLGGLIAHYGFVEYQSVFSKAGIFSPSYWFSNKVYEHTAAIEKIAAAKIFLLAGQNESSTLVSRINQMESLLLEEGFTTNEIQKTIHTDGAHSEWYWAREFPAAYQWLFGDIDFSTSVPTTQKFDIQIYPNPTDSLLHVKGYQHLKQPTLEIVSLQGRSLRKIVLHQDTINTNFLNNGLYIVKLWDGHQVVYSEKIIVNR